MGSHTLNTIDTIEGQVGDGSYDPANGAVYPENSSFGSQLRTVAQMIKWQLGLTVATIDFGGWDTPENQANYFSNRIGEMAESLTAFYTDLNGSGTLNFANRITVVVMSEFGRRLKENNNRGTDHGHGSVMWVLGGKVQGGLYGAWPGLQNEQLYDGADLRITTDYRTVLSEIIMGRLDNPNLGLVFPNITPEVYHPQNQRLGFVQLKDSTLEPNYTSAVSNPNKIYLPFIKA